MAVTIKTPEEQARMRVAGRLTANVLDMIGDYVRPGVTTEELDARCHDRLRATRGVVMSLASLDQERGILTWLGVGNVAGVVFRTPVHSDQRRQPIGDPSVTDVGSEPLALQQPVNERPDETIRFV